MAQLFKRWEEETFHLLGQEIRLKVKAPSFDDSPEILRKMSAYVAAAKRATAERAAAERAAEGTGAPVGASGTEDVLATLDPTWVRSMFTKCVKPAEQIVLDGEEGSPIQTGEQLYEIANGSLVLQVITKIQGMVFLGEAAGKASSSPSTSGAEAGTAPDSGAFPAPITEIVDGPAH